MPQQNIFGKTYYSNSVAFLEGVGSGASFVNDGPIKIGDITVSDKSGYQYMLVLADPEDDEMIEEYDSDTVQLMEVGKKYLAVRPAFSFGEVDGEEVDFPEQRVEVYILPKPDTVLVCDGETEVVEPTPAHLLKIDWYLVRDLKSGKTYWLHTQGYRLTLL